MIDSITVSFNKSFGWQFSGNIPEDRVGNVDSLAADCFVLIMVILCEIIHCN